MIYTKKMSASPPGAQKQKGERRTHLLLRDGVVHQHQLLQPREPAQHVHVGQLGQLVGREHQVRQVRDRAGERRRDGRDAVARQQQRPDPRGQGEVAEELDVIVGQVDGVLWLKPWGEKYRQTWGNQQAQGKEGERKRRTPATPRFSIVGILCPNMCRKKRKKKLDINSGSW